MSKSQNELKAEILAELRQEIGVPPPTEGHSRTTTYTNIGLLILVGFFLGFLLGRRYERVWRTEVASRTAAAPGTAQGGAAGSGDIPPDHPPIEGAGGGDPMAIVKALRARLEADPNDLGALIGMGNMNFDIGRMETSVEYYQRAIALDPTNADVITDMGLAQRNLGNFDEAVQAFELAASVNPSHAQSRLNLGITLMVDKGDSAGALAALEAYLALDPQGPGLPARADVERQVEELRRMTAGEARLHGPEPVTAPKTDGA